MDLSSNALSAAIPYNIRNLSSLHLLNLSGNSLMGSIPASVGELKVTYVLDLSRNWLNGSISSEIGGAVALLELSLDKTFFTGRIPAEIQNCSSMTTLILSQNNLTCSVPVVIANLIELHTVDWSCNQLSGNLPKELTNLSHLHTFNIFHNHLQGELPVGGLFNTIPLSSIAGNPSLGGSIVNNSCHAIHPKPILRSLQEKHKESDTVCVSGKVRTMQAQDHYKMREYNMDVIRDEHDASACAKGRPYPIYPSKNGLNPNFLKDIVSRTLQVLPVNIDLIPKDITQEFGLVCLHDTYLGIHQSKNLNVVDLACRRLIFDEIFYQAAFMVPTELLVVQHYEHLLNLLANIGDEHSKLSVAMLTGLTPSKKSLVIHEGLQTGHISLVIGTHSLIAEKVEISTLGIAVVDEQHCFGVIQRGRFNSKLYFTSVSSRLTTIDPSAFPKGDIYMVPHVLAMSVTPIPRTLALTLYSHLEDMVNFEGVGIDTTKVTNVASIEESVVNLASTEESWVKETETLVGSVAASEGHEGTEVASDQERVQDNAENEVAVDNKMAWMNNDAELKQDELKDLLTLGKLKRSRRTIREPT